MPFTSGTNERTVQYGVYAQARIHLANPLTLVLGAREAFLQDQTQSTLPTVSDWSTDAQINHRFLPSAGLVWGHRAVADRVRELCALPDSQTEHDLYRRGPAAAYGRAI